MSFRITYWVDIKLGYEYFLKQCASHVRREIRKAQDFGIIVKKENSPQVVVGILKISKPHLLKTIPESSFTALINISNKLYQSKQSCCYIAYQNEKAIAGIIYFMYKSKLIYYQGSTLPENKNSGAMSLIIAESIRMNDGKFEILDFDGSMIESIEKFFRGFNAFPVRYTNYVYNQLPFIIRKFLYWKMKS